VQLVEAGPAILADSSPQLTGKATKILSDLGVGVRTHATIAAATADGFRLTDGQLVEGGVFVSVGTSRGVADIAGITTGGRLAHLLKDAIEWEYRQSVQHLRGWDPVPV
jgi:NADH dehydrogenase FAD-containing subunit